MQIQCCSEALPFALTNRVSEHGAATFRYFLKAFFVPASVACFPIYLQLQCIVCGTAAVSFGVYHLPRLPLSLPPSG